MMHADVWVDGCWNNKFNGSQTGQSGEKLKQGAIN